MSSDWFRVSLSAYRFLARLSLQTTVEEAWQDSLTVKGEATLTQEEIVQLLGQLNLSNLLVYDRTPTSASLFERYTTRRRQEIKSLLLGFLAIRIPLWDPDTWLERQLPWLRFLFNPFGLALYLGLLTWGLVSVFPLVDRLYDEASNILAPDNLFLLYVGFVIAKLVHELGHAASCRHHGGEVHTVGVMILLFAPLPYVDASSSWGFRSHWHRLQVGAFGMLSELMVAALAAIVWANTAPGTLNAVAYNVMFVASVSSLLFNLNPLLRFDGYHMLVDLLQVPNLYQRSREQLMFLAEYFLFGLRSARPAAVSRLEVLLLPTYGVASLVYWVFLMLFISAYVASQYVEVGLAIVMLLVITSVVVPGTKFIRYLVTSPRLAQRRIRAWAVTVGLIAGFFAVTGGIDRPEYVRVDGVFQARQSLQVSAESHGELVTRVAEFGHRVQAGELLVRLANPELELEKQAADREMQGLKWQAQRATAAGQVELGPIREQIQALEEKLSLLRSRLAALDVRAPISGIWVRGDFEGQLGQWVRRGERLGQIVQEDEWIFVGVLPQVDTFLFDRAVSGAEVRVRGYESEVLHVAIPRLIPHDNGILPSPALGIPAGGAISVDPTDGRGTLALEPFFRIESNFGFAGDTSHAIRHGGRGTMRVQLADAPLLVHWERRARQFLQRNFRL